MAFQEFQVQFGFAGPGRAGIEGDRAPELGVGKEKGHADRDLECLPRAAVQREVAE